ncbi:putative RNA-directed DNA polymerase [Helianthus annuus]|uniref:Uncharacterized protein n=1 Tax=Helianthus annuus TaxID=4232 RepID=A0A251VJG0_HELAN|nr:putative RNA-directed DNA polymerase [Helianthus annuus]
MALSLTGCQALWIKAKDPVYHGKSKHIRVKYHFIRDLIKKREVEVVFCATKDQIADIMTKALQSKDFTRLRKLLHMNLA